VGDPLVWRSGDGPMADWLERMTDLLVGPQPHGYRVWGDQRWPDQIYGRQTASGLTLAALAEIFTGEGFDGLYVDTAGGLRLDSPTLHIQPLVWQDRGPDSGGVRVMFAEPSGPPAGRVRIFAPLRSPAELAAWIEQLSPLLPAGMPEVRWPRGVGETPLAGSFLHRRDRILLGLDTFDSTEPSFGNIGSVLRVTVPTDGTAPQTVSGRVRGAVRRAGSRRVPGFVRQTGPAPARSVVPQEGSAPVDRSALLAGRGVSSIEELADWLGELSALWNGQPLPKTGRWTGVQSLPRGTRASARESADGPVVLELSRENRPALSVQGPGAEIASWAAPLLVPAVHEEVSSYLPRTVARWLRKVEQAVFAGPAAWTVPGAPTPLSSEQLARWLRTNCPGRQIAVDWIADGAVRLNGALTPTGESTVTGRPDGLLP